MTKPSGPKEVLDSLFGTFYRLIIYLLGRKLWKKKRFIGNEEVGWKTFEKELREILKYPKEPTPSDQLGKDKEVVNLVKFGNILDWFGPFERDDDGLDLLDRLEDMLKKKWFHGDISTPKVSKFYFMCSSHP